MKKKKDIDRQKIEKTLGVFINPKTDFGFHRVFSRPDMMKSFLNEVALSEEKTGGQITSISYLPPEHFGETEGERHVIFDTRCKTNEGKDVVVEMQNAHSMNFVNRLIFYISCLIRSQAPPRGRKSKEKDREKPAEWHYNLTPVYIVAIVNFPMLEGKDEESKNIVTDCIQLMSVKTKQRFSDMLNFVIVDLINFNKTESELETVQDCWLYTLKHAETLEKRPEKIRDKLLIDLYDEILRTQKLTQEEIETYKNSVMEFEKLSFFTDYSKMEGRNEAYAQV
ncbi:MAG: Rpn family recombination-promoting nuclease/putative transposase, partial [Dysgonamonadaceae bacterium]|nr:Rpn family recombination-promoting nuclease/putative transposase [Dysgonamonadaceae bacterium]